MRCSLSWPGSSLHSITELTIKMRGSSSCHARSNCTAQVLQRGQRIRAGWQLMAKVLDWPLLVGLVAQGIPRYLMLVGALLDRIERRNVELSRARSKAQIITE